MLYKFKKTVEVGVTNAIQYQKAQQVHYQQMQAFGVVFYFLKHL